MSAGRRLPNTPVPMHRWPGADGVEIAGDAWGDPNGPVILLQHGGGQTRHAWKGTGETLGRAGYCAVAFDARGHGDSGWAVDGDYREDAMVADLRCVIDALGGRPPVLVGASMGGEVSMIGLAEYGVEASALVLVDIAAKLEQEGSDRIDAFMRQKPEGFESLEEVADAISSYQPQRPRPKSLDGLAKNVRLAEDGRYRWHWDPRIVREFDLEKFGARLEACARELTLPTLLVRGGLSDVLSEEGAKSFLEICPHSEYVNVTNAAHMVAGDRNDLFSDAVVEFLTRAVPVSPPFPT